MALKPKKNLFSLRKMTEIALVNIYRVEHFWQIIIDQLMVISVCNNEDFRALALEAFVIIIVEIFQKRDITETEIVVEEIHEEIKEEIKEETKIPMKEVFSGKVMDVDEKVTPMGRSMKRKVRLDSDLMSDSEEDVKQVPHSSIVKEENIDWEDSRWQIKVLKPFLDSITSTSYEKDQVQMITHLEQIMKKCHLKINSYGWKIICTSLDSLNFARITDPVFELAYSILQYISEEYLALLGNENLKIYMKTIRRFAVHHQGMLDFKNKDEYM